ncbi:MAG: hypothetical protein WCC87_00645 [Candidatus Korobacteraceae bacterium]
MKMYIASLSLLAIACLVAAFPAMAQVVYDNGPDNGQIMSWTLNGQIVSNSVWCNAAPVCPVNEAGFWVWVNPGSPPPTMLVQFSSGPCARTPGNTIGCGVLVPGGTINVPGTLYDCYTNDFGYTVCRYYVSFTAFNLPSGTSYVNLTATPPLVPFLGWDENYGIGCESTGCPSTAYSSAMIPPTTAIPSEAFAVCFTTGGLCGRF